MVAPLADGDTAELDTLADGAVGDEDGLEPHAAMATHATKIESLDTILTMGSCLFWRRADASRRIRLFGGAHRARRVPKGS